MKSKADTAPAPRRVKVGFDLNKADEIHGKLYHFCVFANERIIPALEALEIEVTLSAVIRYTQQPQEMKADYIKREAQLVNNPVLDRIVKDRVAGEFDAIVKLPLSGEKAPHHEFLRLEFDKERAQRNGERPEGAAPTSTKPQRLNYDSDAVEECAAVYLTDPAELEAYDRHQKAVEVMNEFFNGAAPDAWEEPLYNYFVPDPERPGYMKAAELHSYTRFIKK